VQRRVARTVLRGAGRSNASRLPGDVPGKLSVAAASADLAGETAEAETTLQVLDGAIQTSWGRRRFSAFPGDACHTTQQGQRGTATDEQPPLYAVPAHSDGPADAHQERHDEQRGKQARLREDIGHRDTASSSAWVMEG
jgi:hypothetical protein